MIGYSVRNASDGNWSILGLYSLHIVFFILSFYLAYLPRLSSIFLSLSFLVSHALLVIYHLHWICSLFLPSLFSLLSPLSSPLLPLYLPSAIFPALPLSLLLLSLQCPAGFDSVVPSLLQRAEAIVGRQFANDSEFLYAVLKLLHRIGTRSEEGHRWVRGCVV